LISVSLRRNPLFTALSAVKRTLNVVDGTLPSVRYLFRDTVKTANRGTLIPRVFDVLKKYGLVAVDLDWAAIPQSQPQTTPSAAKV
jgi:hypothetical protein